MSFITLNFRISLLGFIILLIFSSIISFNSIAAQQHHNNPLDLLLNGIKSLTNGTTPNPASTSSPPSLGLVGMNLTPDLAKSITENGFLINQNNGFLVTNVYGHSPASNAGIRGGFTALTINGTQLLVGGDIIIKIDNVPIKDNIGISNYLLTKKVGDTIKITIARNDMTLTKKVILTNFHPPLTNTNPPPLTNTNPPPLTNTNPPPLTNTNPPPLTNITISQPSVTNWTTYTNNDTGVSMQYPSNWIRNDTQNGYYAHFDSPESNVKGQYQAELQLHLLNNFSCSNLDDCIQKRIEILKSTAPPDFQVIESSTNANLSSLPAYKIIATATELPGFKLTFTEIGTIVGSSVYYIDTPIQSDQYFNYLPIINNMTDSFQINTAPTNTTYTTYTNNDTGVSMQYPSNWIRNDTQNGQIYATFDSNETDAKNIYLVEIRLGIDNTTSNPDLNSYLQNSIGYYKSPSNGYQNFQVIESGTNYNMSGQPSYKLVGTYFEPNAGVKNTIIETATIVGSSVYYVDAIIQSDQYFNYLPIINNIINSFQINTTSAPYPYQAPPSYSNFSPTNITQCLSNNSNFINSTLQQNISGLDSTYTNQNYGLKINPTNNWKIMECSNSIEVIPSAFFNTTQSEPPGKISIMQFNASNVFNYTPNYLDYLNSSGVENLMVLESGPFLYKGSNSYRFVLTYYDPITNSYIEELNILTIQNNVLYHINYKADLNTYSKYIYSATKIINSIEFLNSENSNPTINDQRQLNTPPDITGGA
jgi:hypothetical protein